MFSLILQTIGVVIGAVVIVWGGWITIMRIVVLVGEKLYQIRDFVLGCPSREYEIVDVKRRNYLDASIKVIILGTFIWIAGAIIIDWPVLYIPNNNPRPIQYQKVDYIIDADISSVNETHSIKLKTFPTSEELSKILSQGYQFDMSGLKELTHPYGVSSQLPVLGIVNQLTGKQLDVVPASWYLTGDKHIVKLPLEYDSGHLSESDMSNLKNIASRFQISVVFNRGRDVYVFCMNEIKPVEKKKGV